MAGKQTPAQTKAMWNRIKASQKSGISAVSGGNTPTTLFSSGGVGSKVAGYVGTPALTTMALVNKETKTHVNSGILNLGEDILSSNKSLAQWREQFPHAKHLNLSGRRLTDDDFVYFEGLESLNISRCRGFTDAAFVHLHGIKELNISGRKHLTDAAFSHLSGIHTLIMEGCDQEGITDAGFANLRGIHTLIMNYCWNSAYNREYQSGITGAALSHLVGIHTLHIKGCFQFSDADFVHLKGIKELNIESTNIGDAAFQYLEGIHSLSILQSGHHITGAGFVHLKGIHTLSMPEFYAFPQHEFAHLRGIKMLNIHGGNFTDIALSYLEGIHTLEIGRNFGITDAGIAHLKGIHTLEMPYCSQETITDAIFTHLKGIHHLNIKSCYQPTLTGANLASLGCNLKTLTVTFCNQTLIDNATRLYGVMPNYTMNTNTPDGHHVKKLPLECSKKPGRLGFTLPSIGLPPNGGRTRTRKQRAKVRKTKKRR